MMNLKAAAQKLGLENDSLGWAILEKLASETDQGPEWNEIWIALMIDRVSASVCKSHTCLSSSGDVIIAFGTKYRGCYSRIDQFSSRVLRRFFIKWPYCHVVRSQRNFIGRQVDN
jgi:hypothetical protein